MNCVPSIEFCSHNLEGCNCALVLLLFFDMFNQVALGEMRVEENESWWIRFSKFELPALESDQQQLVR